MKFSIIAVALLAAIVKASPIPDTEVAKDEVRPVENSATLSNPAASNSDMLVYTDELTDHVERQGKACAAGLKVSGFARIADYTVYGHDFSGDDLANLYNEGKFDNYGGPIVGGAFIRAGILPGHSEAFVQAQNANYYWHKAGSASDIIPALAPNSGYATYIMGDCSMFQSGSDIHDHCCQ
ncbi:hypothetical protein NliqN6_3593 [Naganishia liquefaciens]|uniref:Uncharacterized protein n=1 Tax=Naganishia liquefaciens TaxID=104408 RepID=A0A8H3YH07_9TREE|nr:hypothetical protein NliqN6_3593 [Naganishia liquefaciens]